MSTEKIENLLQMARQDEYEVCIWGAGRIGRLVGLDVLTKLGINVDYFCDNNTALHGKVICDNIVCNDIEQLVNNREKTICFLMLGNPYIEEGIEQAKEKGIKHLVTVNDLLKLKPVMENYFPFMNNKICVYTCITKGYDEIVEPQLISENIDYYLISDEAPCADSVYKWIKLSDVVPQNITDPIYKNRYCKMMAHRLFPDYKYSVYVDGNVRLKKDISHIFSSLKKARIGVGGGYCDSGYYDHAIRCIFLNGDRVDTIYNQVKKYYNEGMPDEFGLFWMAIIFREHNNPLCVKLMEDWWKEFNTHCKRDQISFPYVLWKNGYKREDVLIVPEILGEKQSINSLWSHTGKHKV